MTSPLGSLPQFPRAAFTGLFRLHLELFSPTSESPDAFQFAAMLGALSFLVGRDAGMAWSTGRLYPNLNVGSVGETGLSKKSTPIDDVKSAVIRHFVPPTTNPAEPSRMVVFDGGGSGEGFTEAIGDARWTPPGAAEPELVTGRRALLIIHELAELLAKVKRDQAGSLLDFLLASFDARSPITHVTKNKVTTVTDGTVVVMAASTVDNLVRSLSASSNTTGFLNRIAWFAGDRKEPLHRRPAADPQLHAQLLSEINGALVAVRGREMVLDARADEAHAEFYREHYYREASPALIQATSRADVIALKLAMLFAIANGTTTVTAEHIHIAWDVVEYNREVVSALVEMIPEQSYRDLEDKVLDRARVVAAEHDGQVRVRDVYQKIKSRSLSWDDVERAFMSVVKRGDLVLAGERGNVFRLAIPSMPTTALGD